MELWLNYGNFNLNDQMNYGWTMVQPKTGTQRGKMCGLPMVQPWYHDFNAGLVRFNGNVMGRYWKIPILGVV